MLQKNAQNISLLLLLLFLVFPLPLEGSEKTLSEDTPETFPKEKNEVAPVLEAPLSDAFQIPREAVVTEHTLSLENLQISYDATVGYVPVYDEPKKKETGSIFYVAYTQKTITEDLLEKTLFPRPITFVFNGGPGSPAIWLHMGAFGPVRGPVTNAEDPMPAPPYKAQKNPWTLLPFTDLVFLDPLGTGYSLAPEKSGEAKEFWGIAEDVRAMADVIRMYLTRNRRWGSPVFLLGESYGGIRAAGLAPALQDLGIAPSGIIFIAPALDYGDILGNATNERSLVHRVPTMALAARYHGKTDVALSSEELWQKALGWARQTYLPALWKGNRLEEEEKLRIAREFSSLIGISEEVLLDWNLRIPQQIFAGELCNRTRRFLS
ncbi:MAG TPA: alpha/beta hydrolase, partial [Synergistaceae bacterium]|nr:alpha/beta hydrolase [Synergistaceae bacterium]